MKNIFTSIFLLLGGLLYAQDAHFSQWSKAPFFLNPALTNNTDYDFRLGANYRAQWSPIIAPYRNFDVFFDHRIKSFSWGLNLLQNDAGDASLKSTHLGFALAYHKKMSKKDSRLSIGADLGFVQKRFDPTLMTFDNQYNPDIGYDENLSHREAFEQTSTILPNLGVGIVYKGQISNIGIEVGLSFSHLNRAISTFYEDNSVVLPAKTTAFGRLTLPLSEKFKLQPNLLYMTQMPARKITFGIDGAYNLTEETTLNVGLGMRKDDAFIIRAGIDYNAVSIGASFDVNSSKLSAATSGMGAFELSAIIHFNQTKRVVPIEEEIVEVVENNDRDGDRIPDDVDLCPDIPGLMMYNGCNDSDQDGIIDPEDECPNLFGVRSNKGCPAKGNDADGDGIIDKEDVCPFIKGVAALRGCPDTDLDGISDIDDHCPYMKGPLENRGCPLKDKIEEEKVVTTKIKTALVEFDTDKHLIKSRFYQELDEIAAMVINHEEYTIILSGHTDTEGNEEYNYQLGQRRASAVRAYLVERGVSPRRITMASYGELKPKMDNQSDFGKARNRRTEVHVFMNSGY